MKITLFLTTLFINLSPLALAMEEKSTESPTILVEDLRLPRVYNEICDKALIISEKLISAHSKMELKSSFYNNYKERVDTLESKKLREEVKVLRKSLNERIINLVSIDAATLAKNLWKLPVAVVFESSTGKINESMALFDDYTGLGASTLILNSLRDHPHINFARYNKSEKIDIAKCIQDYSAQKAREGSRFIQPSDSQKSYLLDQAVTINKFATRLIQEWSKG